MKNRSEFASVFLTKSFGSLFVIFQALLVFSFYFRNTFQIRVYVLKTYLRYMYWTGMLRFTSRTSLR